MFWIVYALFFAAVVFFALRFGKKRRNSMKYVYRRDLGAFYMENGDLVLNGMPTQYAPVSGLDHVEIDYDIYYNDHHMRYEFTMKLINRDGTETKPAYYKSFKYGNNVLNPAEIAKQLEAQGVRCMLPTGKGSLLRGNIPE